MVKLSIICKLRVRDGVTTAKNRCFSDFGVRIKIQSDLNLQIK